MSDPKSRFRWLPAARRFLTEGLVIVASILVAFAIDAWWDGRQEDRARHALLAALRQDAALIQREIDRVREGLTPGFHAHRAFLALEEEPGLSEADAGRIDGIIGAQFRATPFDAPLGAAQALLSGTDLSTVESDDLVASVTRLVSLFGSLERDQTKLADNVAHLHERLAELGVDMTHMGVGAERMLLARQRPTTAWRHVDDPRLRTLAWFGWHFTWNVLENLDLIEAELRTIEALVDERLGG